MAENSVIDMLRKGQESTEKLKVLLVQHKLPPEVAGLLQSISGVFNEAIAASPEPFPTGDENGMYNSSKKRRAQVAPKFGGRKRADPNLSNKVINQSIDDGFTWRKYGQKEIFSAKYPRSYFRCTHKYDENCQATRQVQQSEQHSGMYEITYIGDHTCKQAKKHCQEQEQPCIINFKSNTNNPIKQLSEQVNTSNNFLGLELESITSDSFSMEFDSAPLEFENIESMFSYDQEFGSLFQ